MLNITLHQIKAFLVVAKFLNYSKAARYLYVTQPTLSKTIKTFENTTGLVLFKRGNYNVSLTEAGEYLYHALENVYGDLERVIEYAIEINADAPRKLRVVLPFLFDQAEIFAPIKKNFELFSEKYPDIIVETILHENCQIYRTIELGMADIAIIMDYVLHETDGLDTKQILKMKRYLVVSKNHPIARHDNLDDLSFDQEVFFHIMDRGDEYVMQTLVDECERYGFKPKRIEFLPNHMTFFQSIKEGKGLGICGKFSNYGEEYGIKYYPLPERNDSYYIIAAWRQNSLTKEAQELLDLI